jgi:hypothetical protein
MKKVMNWFVNNGPIILLILAGINALNGEWSMAFTNVILASAMTSMNNNKNK